MQCKNIAAAGVLGIAGAAIVTTFAFVASAQSPGSPPVAPAGSAVVVQVTDAPSSTIDTTSLAPTTTKAPVKTPAKAEVQVQTTEQATARTVQTQQRQAAAADDPEPVDDGDYPADGTATRPTPTNASPSVPYRGSPCQEDGKIIPCP
jgi:hypothetical protein